ncbi:NAD-dependent epimerase/dehydratase family protein [Psychrobacillus sp. NPDC058041]|uniref:NAD-dependent epimerase/dehydratase family protein n=1 Tax=Psychrobacillus sp. NPDC058041 TaxID=3346310 RepID=UPI0036D76174
MKRKARIMITGANGFTGLHACQYFKKAGYDVIAVSRELQTNILDERIHLEQCDLTDKHQVRNLIRKAIPDQILHLAGQNNVQDSWNEPITSLEANAMSTAYIIDSIRQENLPCKIIIVGSALQLDLRKSSLFQDPYSLSKTIQVLVAQSWESLYGMDIVIAKPSNLIGPGDSTGVCSILAKKVAEMELRGSERVLTVNNLFVQRDFIDVRDAIRAYEKLFDIGKSGEIYDISSGKPRFLKDITDALQNLSMVDFNIQTLQNNHEKIEVTTPKKLLNAGWSPLISFEKSLEDILVYQRENLH